MRVKTKTVLVLMMIMSLVISVTACTSPPKPTAGENSGKFETSAVQESSKAQESSENESSDGQESSKAQVSSDSESSVLEVQQEEHQDGDIYMTSWGLTLYVERLEQCENWLDKTHAEAGIPEEFEDEIHVEGTIFGFPAHGTARYRDGKCHKITLYLSKNDVTYSDLYEILVMENGRAYESTMSAYVESLGGCVTQDYFATGKGTIILETAELRNYCSLTFTPDQAPEHEPTEGNIALSEIKDGTGFDFTLPEDDYHDLFGGKLEGSELNWYYLNFTMDDGVFCQVDLIDDVTEEEAAEKVFNFVEYMKGDVVTENGYSMVIDEEKESAAVFWFELRTAFRITVDYSQSKSVVDYDYLRHLRLGIIAAYEQPE